jgi:hypothetical protein
MAGPRRRNGCRKCSHREARLSMPRPRIEAHEDARRPIPLAAPRA